MPSSICDFFRENKVYFDSFNDNHNHDKNFTQNHRSLLSPELGVKVQELSKFNASPFVIDQAIYEQTNRLPNSHLMEHYKTSREKPSDLTPTHFEDIQKLFKKGFAIHSVWDSHKHYLHGIIVKYEICKKALFFSNK